MCKCKKITLICLFSKMTKDKLDMPKFFMSTYNLYPDMQCTCKRFIHSDLFVHCMYISVTMFFGWVKSFR